MRRYTKLIALGVAASIFSGCILSRAVDRAFLGVTVRRPQYKDRMTTGVFLLPFTFAVDVVTAPIQAILIVILGDQFPFNDTDALQSAVALNDNPQFKRLNDEQKAIAMTEFKQLMASSSLTPNTILALTEDGHWMLTEVSDEGRAQLLARVGQTQGTEVLVSR